jgi:hypothetical protein
MENENVQKNDQCIKVIKYLAIPVMVYPYIIILGLISIFSGGELFHDDGMIMLLGVPIWGVIALILAIIISIIIKVKKVSAEKILRLNMMIKVVQIPAYIVIFFLGLACMITIFTMLVTILLIILDCLTILTTGIIGAASVARARKEKILSTGEAVAVGIFQFLFCADVISAVILYIGIAKKKKILNINKGNQRIPGL